MKTGVEIMNPKRKSFSIYSTSLLFPFLISACGQVDGLMEAQPGTFSHVYNTVLSDCLQCHNGENPSDFSELDFSTKEKAYSSLQGSVSGPLASGNCAGVKLITEGSPTNSYFAAVLLTEFAVNSGIAGDADCVPYANHLQDQNLTESERNSIKDWITAGASNN